MRATHVALVIRSLLPNRAPELAGRREAKHSKDSSTVDIELKMKPETIGRFATKVHAGHENLKIIHHGAYFRINFEEKRDGLRPSVEPKLRLDDGIVHPVMNIFFDGCPT